MVELTIKQDTEPSLSPREWDNLGTMVCWHHRYSLGDEQPNDDNEDWFKENITDGCVYLPLYLYDHSGITMKTTPFSCLWDSGQVGWIFATLEKIKEQFIVDSLSADTVRNRVIEILTSEVKVYDQYLRGQVWSYEYGDDSCCGFFGDELEETGILDSIPEEAKQLAEAAWDCRE